MKIFMPVVLGVALVGALTPHAHAQTKKFASLRVVATCTADVRAKPSAHAHWRGLVHRGDKGRAAPHSFIPSTTDDPLDGWILVTWCHKSKTARGWTRFRCVDLTPGVTDYVNAHPQH